MYYNGEQSLALWIFSMQWCAEAGRDTRYWRYGGALSPFHANNMKGMSSQLCIYAGTPGMAQDPIACASH